MLAAGALALAACGQESTATEDPDPPSHGHSHAHGTRGHGHADGDEEAPRVERPPARLSRATGLVTIDGAQATPGAALDAESTVVVPADGNAVLVLRDGARVELDGPSTVRVVSEGSAQVFLVRGRAFASQPPNGNAARPPLRIATPAATMEVVGDGEFYTSTFENGSTWIATMSGVVSVSADEADARHRLRAIDVTAGQSLAIAGRLGEPIEGPNRLPAARAAANALAGGEGMSEPDPEALTRGFRPVLERLDQALRWLETETRRGSELTAQHRAAAQAGEQEEASRLQREIVAHSQELYRLRGLATTRWERARAQKLFLDLVGAGPSPDPIAERHDRVAGLLGFGASS
ncbi:MAG: FecR family protein [Sandaracinaceae bacterium]